MRLSSVVISLSVVLAVQILPTLPINPSFLERWTSLIASLFSSWTIVSAVSRRSNTFTLAHINTIQYLIKFQKKYKIRTLLKYMYQRDNNWYIEYDYKIFQILFDKDYLEMMYKVSEAINKQRFQLEQNNSIKFRSQPVDSSIPAWINEISEAITQIVTLLYNFFTVQQKLNTQPIVNKQFHTARVILKVEKQYVKFFNERSTQFRFNRMLACCMRLSKFYEWILKTSAQIKKYTDKALQDNLAEVSLFFQQRIRETLEITQQQGDMWLNLLLIDILSTILRHNGDLTMKPILSETKYKIMMDDIMKENQRSEQFQVQKAQAKIHFQQNKFFKFVAQEQIDPNLLKNENSSSQYSF